MAKTKSKSAVTNTKTAAFECFYAEIREKGKEKRLYMIAKEREKSANLDQVKFIKDKEGDALLDETSIK